MTCKHPRLFGFWDHLATVPYLPVAAWIAFVTWPGVLAGGIQPPGGDLPAWLALAWTLGFAVGSTLAVIGGLTRRTRIESSGLGLLLGGLVFYGLAAVIDSSNQLIGTLSAVVAFSLMAVIRMRVLSLARKAQLKANDLMLESEQ